MAIFNDVLLAARTLVEGLGLAGVAAVLVRKLPGPADVLDPLPLITVCPAPTGESEKPLSFASKDCVYPAQFTVIRPGNGDLVSNLDWVLLVRQAIRDLFYLPTGMRAVVPSIWMAEYAPAPPLDRRKVNQNYDYSSFVIRFHSQEARS